MYIYCTGILTSTLSGLQDLQEFRDKYKLQARELKDAVAKQKIAIEQFTDTNESYVHILLTCTFSINNPASN